MLFGILLYTVLGGIATVVGVRVGYGMGRKSLHSFMCNDDSCKGCK